MGSGGHLRRKEGPMKKLLQESVVEAKQLLNLGIPKENQDEYLNRCQLTKISLTAR